MDISSWVSRSGAGISEQRVVAAYSVFSVASSFDRGVNDIDTNFWNWVWLRRLVMNVVEYLNTCLAD